MMIRTRAEVWLNVVSIVFMYIAFLLSLCCYCCVFVVVRICLLMFWCACCNFISCVMFCCGRVLKYTAKIHTKKPL